MTNILKKPIHDNIIEDYMLLFQSKNTPNLDNAEILKLVYCKISRTYGKINFF